MSSESNYYYNTQPRNIIKKTHKHDNYDDYETIKDFENACRSCIRQLSYDNYSCDIVLEDFRLGMIRIKESMDKKKRSFNHTEEGIRLRRERALRPSSGTLIIVSILKIILHCEHIFHVHFKSLFCIFINYCSPLFIRFLISISAWLLYMEDLFFTINNHHHQVPAVLLEHWYEQLSRHLGLQYIAANHRNERKGADNDGSYNGDKVNTNVSHDNVDNDNYNDNNSNNDNDSSSSSSSNNSNSDNNKKVKMQRNKLNNIFQFNIDNDHGMTKNNNNDDNDNGIDINININDIDLDNKNNHDTNNDNININEVLNYLNVNTLSDLRGVVYIDGLGDIVDVQPPLANLQVWLCEYLYKNYVIRIILYLMH